MSIKTRFVAGAGALALAAGALAVVAPAAGAADQNLLTCTGGMTYASLNPTLGSASSKYMKSASKGADGTKHLSLTGQEDLGATGVDALQCTVDAGIRTNNPATNSASGKENPFDNQTNGHSVLHVSKQVASTSGSSTCNAVNPDLNRTYPTTYPTNGKTVWFFTETDAASKPIQIQQYIRLGLAFGADPNHRELSITGTVIKGPGIGGSVGGTLSFSALYDPKGNLNALDCFNTPTSPQPWAGNTSLKTLLIQGADGPDGDALVDPWTISIPGA